MSNRCLLIHPGALAMTLLLAASGCGDEQLPAPGAGDVAIESTAPTQATERLETDYQVSCTGPADVTLSLTVGERDTCQGELTDLGGGTGNYRFTPGETRGGRECLLEIICTGDGRTATQTSTIEILEDHQAPVITNLPATESSLRFQFDYFDADAVDPDIPPGALSWILSDSTCGFTIRIEADTGLVSWTCGDVQNCQVDLTVSDSSATPLSDTRTLTIHCANSLPAFTTLPSSEAWEHREFNYTAACTDPEEDPVTFGFGTGDTCGGILTDYLDGTGEYIFTPGEAQGGTSCEIDITCSDGIDAQSQSATVSIQETNQPPVITNLPHTETGVRGESDSYLVAATDADLPVNSLTYSLSDNTCGYPLTVHESSGLVSWTYSRSGTCTVRVTASDDAEPAGRDVETLTLRCFNYEPTFTSTAPGSVVENNTYVYEARCTDTEDDPLTLDVHERDTCDGTLEDHGNGTGTYRFTPNEYEGYGECLVAVRCDDPYDTVIQTTLVSIAEDNITPVLTNLPATVTSILSVTDGYQVQATDDDIPPNQLSWQIVSDTCSFDPAIEESTGQVSWTCTVVEECVVQVKVTDDGTPAGEAGGALTISCSTGEPSFTTLPPESATENALYTYAIACSDPTEGSAWLALGAADTCGGTLDDDGDGEGTYTFTPDESQGGSDCVVEVTCTNSYGEDTATATVSIEEDNQPPEFVNLPYTYWSSTQQPGSYYVQVDDPDDPSNTLNVTLELEDCSFDVTFNPAGNLVSWTCGESTESCSAIFMVVDDVIPPASDVETLTIECI